MERESTPGSVNFLTHNIVRQVSVICIFTDQVAETQAYEGRRLDFKIPNLMLILTISN